MKCKDWRIFCLADMCEVPEVKDEGPAYSICVNRGYVYAPFPSPHPRSVPPETFEEEEEERMGRNGVWILRGWGKVWRIGGLPRLESAFIVPFSVKFECHSK